MAIITPTVGRVVWYWERGAIGKRDREQPCAAIVTGAFGNHTVNLCVFATDGTPYSCRSVSLVQEGEPDPMHPFAEWMPYQKGQAAKTEAAEAALQTKG